MKINYEKLETKNKDFIRKNLLLICNTKKKIPTSFSLNMIRKRLKFKT